MKCPYCGDPDQRVLDSRPARDGEAIRRRRECTRCGRRFTTFEAPELARPYVLKRSGEREEFDREKLLRSMVLACGKRPVGIERLQGAADKIERDLSHRFTGEVPSRVIGERVLHELSQLDDVAFVRYASVYREFDSLEEFSALIEDVKRAEGPNPSALAIMPN
ncbi:MAG: transcriptional regulator NrdR [Fimbriimonadaceae bacterium]|nr:transcriptional regulator NrdR [Fimbriimonadaceae bacterium]QYK55364.1 MAG: transcriptional regulator NrdR [Fimbriimonadaceae bacterium]